VFDLASRARREEKRKKGGKKGVEEEGTFSDLSTPQSSPRRGKREKTPRGYHLLLRWFSSQKGKRRGGEKDRWKRASPLFLSELGKGGKRAPEHGRRFPHKGKRKGREKKKPASIDRLAAADLREKGKKGEKRGGGGDAAAIRPVLK